MSESISAEQFEALKTVINDSNKRIENSISVTHREIKELKTESYKIINGLNLLTQRVDTNAQYSTEKFAELNKITEIQQKQIDELQSKISAMEPQLAEKKDLFNKFIFMFMSAGTGAALALMIRLLFKTT